jgi:hypothetical protein
VAREASAIIGPVLLGHRAAGSKARCPRDWTLMRRGAVEPWRFSLWYDSPAPDGDELAIYSLPALRKKFSQY